jgi:photosystem II stability/assembly factor-like uncharacterized protein
MSSVLLVGTAVTRPGAVGTLYRSVDGGGWQPAAGIPLDTGVQAFTSHPDEPGTVFAATRVGVYKSTNSGESWTRLAVPSQNEEFWSVTIHPLNHNVVFAGAAPVGVYRSDDGGEHWRRVGSSARMPELCDLSKSKGFNASRLMRIYCDPTRPELMFGACETNGMIVSEDGGQSWRDASNTLIELANENENLKSAIVAPEQFEGMVDGHAVLVSQAKPGVVFYACRMGVFSSADRGRTWHNHDIGRFAPITYSRDLRIALDDPKTFYLTLSISARSEAGAFYMSRDTGETWKRADEQVTAKSTIMSMNVHGSDPRKLVYVTRGGQVMWTEDRCASWKESQLPAQAGDGFCAAVL